MRLTIAAMLALAPLPALAAPACDTLDSAAGQAWAAQNLWRYADRMHAAEVYRDLADSALPSSWPDGIAPQYTVLARGTRFQMAIAKSQIQPDGAILYGGYGTFQRIDTRQQARDVLAVRSDFKPTLDVVLTLEVTQPLPALVGATGPQVEPTDCHLLPGGAMQLQMIVLPRDRALYLRIVEQRALQ